MNTQIKDNVRKKAQEKRMIKFLSLGLFIFFIGNDYFKKKRLTKNTVKYIVVSKRWHLSI